MKPEFLLIPAIFIFSLGLLISDKKLALYFLLVFSVFLHKQFFGIQVWNLLIIRVYMVAFLAWCIGWVVLYLYRGKSLKPIKEALAEPFIFLLVALWLVRLASLPFTKNILASFSLFAFFTTMVALGIFLYYLLREKPDQVLVYIKFYIGLAFGLCLFACFQAYLFLDTGKIIGALWNVPGRFPRLGSLFWDVNHFGSFLASLLPVLGAFVLLSKKPNQAIARILAFGLMCGVLVSTSSRTSWILAGVSAFSFVSIRFYKHFRAKGVAITLGILLVCSSLFLLEYRKNESPLRLRIKEYFHYRMDSFDAHFMLLKGSEEIFRKYPILGGGYGGFFEHFTETKVSVDYFGKDTAAFTTRVPAHTIWGETLAETGLLGITTFILFMAFILGSLLYLAFKSNSKEQSLLSSAMFSSILGWLVAGIFYSYNSEFFFIILFLYFMYAVSCLGKDLSIAKLLDFLNSRADLGFVFLAILSIFLIFVSLGKNHLIPWDEAIYAKIAKNMVKSGDYLNMEWVPGKAWYEKPPLLIWLMAGFMNLLGVGEWSARFPSALFGLGTILLIYYWAREQFGKSATFVSGLSLLTTAHFLYYARCSMMDVAVGFFITLGLYFYCSAKQKSRSVFWILSGISIGLGAMTKGVVGLLPLPIITIYEIYLFLLSGQKFSWSLAKNYLLLFLYFLIVISPWHLYMHLHFGKEFWNNYLGYHVLGRAFSNAEGKSQPFLWYFVVLKVSMRIWFVALIPAFFYGVFKATKKENIWVFFTIWSLITFLFFSVSTSKLIWYIIPIYPVLAMFVGVFVRDAVNLALGWLFTFWNRLSKSQFGAYPSSWKFLVYFGITVFGLTYFYFNKNLVYTSDLSGPQASLLELKDKRYGVSSKVYTDRIELPLVLFYTDGPFEEVDFGPLRKVLKRANESALGNSDLSNKKITEPVVFITKLDRFATLQKDFLNLIPVSQNGDWVLGEFPVASVAQPL